MRVEQIIELHDGYVGNGKYPFHKLAQVYTTPQVRSPPRRVFIVAPDVAEDEWRKVQSEGEPGRSWMSRTLSCSCTLRVPEQGSAYSIK